MSDLDSPTSKIISVIDESEPRLIYNDYDNHKRVLTTLLMELKHCESFCFSVAFITHGGLSCLKQQIINSQDMIHGRIITTDYLNFNEPKALRDLLRFPNIKVRVFTSQGFHTKGYLFDKKDETTLLVGSSNLTQDALNKTKEWNVRMSSKEGNSTIIEQTRVEFERMWNESEPLTLEWIAEYEPKHQKAKFDRDKLLYPDEKYRDIIKPNSMQVEALQNLTRIRNSGEDRALLISATGTGKTYLSAFDVKESGAKKVLFLVHREQILDAAKKSFENILGSSISTGKIGGGQHQYDADFIFSTIASMSKKDIRNHFTPDHFDYIVCDEAHHSVANSYNSIIEYFKPRFFLGMTATPERMDGSNVFEQFNHNIAYEIRLQDALDKEMLCPFHYFGISDIEIDGQPIDADEDDFNSLASDERVRHIIDKSELYGYSGDRVKGLIFCKTIDEGRLISEKLNREGLKTKFLCGNDDAETREKYVNLLEKNHNPENTDEEYLDYILTVDIFNEGVDIRSVNQIIMLRPTQSSTIFIQQLGRGLRKMTHDNKTKEYLVVIDFIGNYKNNFLIPIALTGDSSLSRDNWKKHLMIPNDGIPGCSTVDFDLIAKERIFEAIDVNNSVKDMIKDQYSSLCDIYGRALSFTELYHLNKISPMVIVNEYDTLNKLRRLTDAKYYNYSKSETDFLKFIGEHLLIGARPHELIILDELVEHGKTSFEQIKNRIGESGLVYDQKSVESSLNFMSCKFYKSKPEQPFLIQEGSEVMSSEYFEKLMTIPGVKNDLSDIIQCGLETFEKEYLPEYDGLFTKYLRYSRLTVNRLLNWDCFNNSINGYLSKDGFCPIFVTYHKREDISATTKYDDHFVNRGIFNWYTRSKRHTYSKQESELLSPDCTLFLFVKKSDEDSKDFFYLGRVKPIMETVTEKTIMNDKNEEVPIVNMDLRLENPVPQEIYDFIIGE